MNDRLPLISIQILNWNRAEESLRAIHSAQEQTYPNIEIIFVDNGSTDNSVKLVKSTYPDIKIVQLDKNYGCPDGRNKGIEYCDGEFIFYLDNDGVLHREALTRAYQVIKEDDKIGVVAGIIYDFDDPEEIDTEIIPKSTNRYPYANFQGGICLHRKAIYSKIGMYPSHFFYGGEEMYLTCKILDNEIRIVKDESVILWHKKSEMARDLTKELLNSYYNKLYVCLSLYPLNYALYFLIYFPYRYPFYAKQNNIKREFIRSLLSRFPKTTLAGLRNREPIKVSTYNKMKGSI